MADQINLEALANIIGKDTQELMVYGFNPACFCFSRTLEEHGFKVYDYRHADAFEAFIKYDDSDRDDFGKLCKASLTNLIFENYKRSKTNQPLIPLVFCTNIEAPDQTTNVDARQVAQSRDPYAYTNQELRRVYKFRSEMDAVIKELFPTLNITDDIKQIADQTITFVKLKVSALGKNDEYYDIEAVEPFWNDPEWSALWSERVEARKIDETKPYPWRTELATSIHDWSVKFFKSSNNNDTNNNHSQLNEQQLNSPKELQL